MPKRKNCHPTKWLENLVAFIICKNKNGTYTRKQLFKKKVLMKWVHKYPKWKKDGLQQKGDRAGYSVVYALLTNPRTHAYEAIFQGKINSIKMGAFHFTRNQARIGT